MNKLILLAVILLASCTVNKKYVEITVEDGTLTVQGNVDPQFMRENTSESQENTPTISPTIDIKPLECNGCHAAYAGELFNKRLREIVEEELDKKEEKEPTPIPPAPEPPIIVEPIPDPPPANVSWSKTIDHGTNGYIETGNSWVSYNYPSAHGNSYRYLSHQNKNVPRVGTAKWIIQSAPYDGAYEISVGWRASDNRTPDADYAVFVNGAKVFGKSYNQRGDGMKKVVLGKFQVLKGQRIEVLLDGTDDNHSDCADAAYFRYVQASMGY